MDIIHQTMEIITQGYYESLKKLMAGESSASDIVIELEGMLRQVGTKLAGEALEQLDEAIRKGRERKKEWHIERRGDEKTIATVLGEVSYQRTYYRHKERREYAYLSDEWAGIESHARMDDSLRVKLTENAADGSYQKAVEREKHSGIVSKSGVMNAIRRIGKLDNEAAKIKGPRRTMEIVYVEADEDHVALQQGGTALAKIIYVHEGKEWVSKGRYRLKGVRYFSGADQSSEELWLEVARYLDSAYEGIGKVFISGDGHRWIKEGLNWIDKSVFVLDRFHLAKYVRQASGHMEEAREPLWGYLERGMSRAVGDLLDVLEEYAPSPGKKQEVRDARRYIENHWVAIQRQKSQGYVGCSAEGHVSHILSARFSSRPMGWSLLGLDLLARMRAFQFNKGNLYDYVRYQKLKEARDKRIRKLDLRVWSKAKKTSYETLGNLAAVNYGKRNGTQVLLKMYRGI